MAQNAIRPSPRDVAEAFVVDAQPTLHDTEKLAEAEWADPTYIANRFPFENGQLWLGRSLEADNQPIGYDDDRHVLVCAGGRSGKGRSFIINNLALWKGSTVVYDPKGELPDIMAARRGAGNDDCDGLKQKTYILDPLGHSNCPAEQRAFFDPLSGLDPEDDEFVTFCRRIAASLVKLPDHGGESGEWAKRSVRYISTVIMHVMTSHLFPDAERNLKTVLDLVQAGEQETVQILMDEHRASERERKQKAVADGKQYVPNKIDIPDPVELLLKMMSKNRACDGAISREAFSLLRSARESSRYFESVRGEATDQLAWLESRGIRKSLTGVIGRDENGDAILLDDALRFDPKDLKNDPKGVSVFIVMPVNDLDQYQAWLQAVFLGIFSAVRGRDKPKSNSPILTVLDEFSSIGHQDYIIKSADNIASSGMKMMIVVQNIETLKDMYKDRAQSFFTNMGAELYFGKVGKMALDHLMEELGEIEVAKVGRSQNFGENESQSASRSIAEGQTDTYGTADSEGTSISKSKNRNTSRGTHRSRHSGYNYGSGYNSNRSRDASGLFPRGFSSGYSSNSGRSGGRGSGSNSNVSHGTGENVTKQKTRTTNESHATTKTETRTAQQSRGLNRGETFNETFHKRPLIERQDLVEMLTSIRNDDRDDLFYPGLILVNIADARPFFLRRSNYDEDDYFVRKFSPDPSFPFVPIEDQKPQGFEYTEAHDCVFQLPDMLHEAGFSATPLVRPTQHFEAGAPLFQLVGSFKTGPDGDERTTYMKTFQAPFDGRILDVQSPDEQRDTGDILVARFTEKWSIRERTKAMEAFVKEAVEKVRAEVEAERQKRAQKQQRQEVARLEVRRAETAIDRKVDFIDRCRSLFYDQPYVYLVAGAVGIVATYYILLQLDSPGVVITLGRGIMLLFAIIASILTLYFVSSYLFLVFQNTHLLTMRLKSKQLDILQKKDFAKSAVDTTTSHLGNVFFTGLVFVVLAFLYMFSIASEIPYGVYRAAHDGGGLISHVSPSDPTWRDQPYVPEGGYNNYHIRGYSTAHGIFALFIPALFIMVSAYYAVLLTLKFSLKALIERRATSTP